MWSQLQYQLPQINKHHIILIKKEKKHHIINSKVIKARQEIWWQSGKMIENVSQEKTSIRVAYPDKNNLLYQKKF